MPAAGRSAPRTAASDARDGIIRRRWLLPMDVLSLPAVQDPVRLPFPVSVPAPVPAPAATPAGSPRRRAIRALAAAGLAGGIGLGWPTPGAAHHGFVGLYDVSRPIYLAGRIASLWLGLPHGRVAITLPADLALPVDRDPFRALEDVEGRQVLSRLRLPERKGTVEVVLDGRMTRRLIDEPDGLPVGLRTELIAYLRTSRDEHRGELLVVLLRLADRRLLVGSGPASSRRAEPRRDGRPAEGAR